MKNLIVLFAPEKSKYIDEPLFDGKSAKELSVAWASSFADSTVCTMQGAACVYELLREMSDEAKRVGAERVVFAFSDCPFLNKALSEKLLETHEKYAAEYTFADGYPLGFAPEIIDTGALSLLTSLCSPDGVHKDLGAKKIGRDAIFSAIKGDINSFEIETVMAEEDFRQYRLNFACDTKANALCCKRLFDMKLDFSDALSLSRSAVKNASILHTLPSFYRVQLTDAVDNDAIFTPFANVYKMNHGVFASEDTRAGKAKEMPFEKFCAIVDNIASFSETAVVALACGGEPLLSPYFDKAVEKVLSYSGLSVLIETSGYNVTQELAEKIAEIAKKAPLRTGNYPSVMWIVSVDAVDSAKYGGLHKNAKDGAFEKACAAVGILSEKFLGDVYPEFLRVNENEEQLEAFFRFWKNAQSPSAGNVLVQKYDWLCSVMKDDKVADLTPLERFPCWHLRRDIIINADGFVPLCPEWTGESDFIGNAFESSLSDIWDKYGNELDSHLTKCYSQRCALCDEFYTFNF